MCLQYVFLCLKSLRLRPQYEWDDLGKGCLLLTNVPTACTGKKMYYLSCDDIMTSPLSSRAHLDPPFSFFSPFVITSVPS